MQIIHKISELNALLKLQDNIGFVPTMGALHAGHIALAQVARKKNKCVVVSIFVNPTQFGPNEDFTRYPRTLEADCEALTHVDIDYVFAPSVEEMYPTPSEVMIQFPRLASVLCGRSRPTHFQGVGLIVTKLFNIVNPTIAYFGQKDFQQTVIIKRLVQELNFNVKIEVCPTIREVDGLALSSRNRYLNIQERGIAPVLFRSLQIVQEKAKKEKNVRVLVEYGKEFLSQIPEINLDYFEILNAYDLSEIELLDAPAVCAAAIYLGPVRLIDNILI